MSIFIYKFYW